MGREKSIFIAVVVFLSMCSFFLRLYIFNLSESGSGSRTVETRQDSLSGEEYSTAGIYNYRDANPYSSYLVGFDTFRDRGITNGEMIYIRDVLVNFTMYNEKVYNGKVSYVSDSFVFLEQENEKEAGQKRYSFDFGINDGSIHTMEVSSNWLEDQIAVKITDQSDKEVFSKEFTIHPTPSS